MLKFGDAIGGLKYVKPNDLNEDRTLDNRWTRMVTLYSRGPAQDGLVRISKILDAAFVVDGGNDTFDKWKELRVKLEELFIENRDLGKSLQRMVKDLENDQYVGVGFFTRVRQELVGPLRAFIRENEAIPIKKRKELTNNLDYLDRNALQTKAEFYFGKKYR